MAIDDKSALDYLDTGAYAHFSSTPQHFGINPDRQKNIQLSGGPEGIYAYEWTSDMLHGRMKFAHNRSSVIIFYPSNPDKILDADKYTQQNFETDLEKLRFLIDPLLIDNALKRHEKYTGKFDVLKRTLSDAYSLPIGKLYYLISKVEKKELYDPEEAPINYMYPGLTNYKFTTEIFKILGYDGFTDRHGLIQSSEPYQSVFFKPQNLRVVGVFPNPLISTQDNTMTNTIYTKQASKNEKIPLSVVRKMPYKSLNRMIKKMREYLKKNEIVQDMFKDYGVDIEEIDYIPMMFGNIDVSAKTDHGVIIYNYKLLTDADFFKDFSYGVHEMTHWLQQTTGSKATRSSDDGNYLDNPYEQEGFQNQVEYIADQFGEGEAEQYVDDLLEHHEVENKKEFEDKKETLMAKV